MRFELIFTITGKGPQYFQATEDELRYGGLPDIREIIKRSNFFSLPSEISSHQHPFAVQQLTIIDDDNRKHTVTVDSEVSMHTPLQEIINVLMSVGARQTYGADQQHLN